MILADPAASAALGARLAALVAPGDVVTLSGALGAGKTSVARGLLAALGLAGEAPSPSFAIVQPYAPPEVRIPVLHVDLYRIADPREIAELGLDEAADESVLLVEWPERAPGWWPDALALTLAILPGGLAGGRAGGSRRLTATVPPGWKKRWQQI